MANVALDNAASTGGALTAPLAGGAASGGPGESTVLLAADSRLRSRQSRQQQWQRARQRVRERAQRIVQQTRELYQRVAPRVWALLRRTRELVQTALNTRRKRIIAVWVGIAVGALLLLVLLVNQVNHNNWEGFVTSRCTDASVPLCKVKRLVGLHIHSDDGAQQEERQAGEYILQQARGPWVLATIQAVLTRTTLLDARLSGVVMTVDDMNRIAECMLEDHASGARLEEHRFTSSGVQLFEGDMLSASEGTLYEYFAGAEMTAGDHWASGSVSYCYAPGVSAALKAAWEAAVLDATDQVPCVHIREINNDGKACETTPSIVVTANPRDGCWSYVGRVSGTDQLPDASQELNLGTGCETKGMAAHQLGHALGLFHQQARPDRAAWLELHPDRVYEGLEDPFPLHKNANYTHAYGYDVLSVMHCGAQAFSEDGEATVEAKDDRFTRYLGQRLGFSTRDVEQISHLYGCAHQARPETKSERVLWHLHAHAAAALAPWTTEGCLCETIWGCTDGCCAPDADHEDHWCRTRGLCLGMEEDTCKPVPLDFVAPTTKKGCFCRTTEMPACGTEENGFCCNHDHDPEGTWCYTEGNCGEIDYDYCIPPSQATDCKWSEWSGWSGCSTTCDQGQMTRTRQVEQEAADGGQPCDGDDADTKRCDVQPCKGQFDVRVVMTIRNVDSARLMSHQHNHLHNRFVSNVKEAIAEQSGAGVAPRDVHVRLSEGSVVVHATVIPPAGVEAEHLRETLGHAQSSGSMGENVASRLSADPELDEVATGALEVHVSEVSLSVASTTSTTRTTTTTTTTFPYNVPVIAQIRWHRHPEKCMDIYGGLAHNGNVPQIWDCGHSRNQKFILPYGGTGQIRWAEFPNLCLNTPRANQVMWWDCARSHPQNIIFEVPRGGRGVIRSGAHPSMCLDVPDGRNQNGVWLQMWECGDEESSVDGYFNVEVQDCAWGAWSGWSQCTHRCEGGQRMRSAQARGGPAAHAVCGENLQQTMHCNDWPCEAAASHPSRMLPESAFLRWADNDRKCVKYQNDIAMLQDCVNNEDFLFMLPASGVGPIRSRMHPEKCLQWPSAATEQASLRLADCELQNGDDIRWVWNNETDDAICLASRPQMCIHENIDHSLAVRLCTECPHLKVLFVDCVWQRWSELSECHCPGQAHIGTRSQTRTVHQSHWQQSCNGSMTETVNRPCRCG